MQDVKTTCDYTKKLDLSTVKLFLPQYKWHQFDNQNHSFEHFIWKCKKIANVNLHIKFSVIHSNTIGSTIKENLLVLLGGAPSPKLVLVAEYLSSVCLILKLHVFMDA